MRCWCSLDSPKETPLSTNTSIECCWSSEHGMYPLFCPELKHQHQLEDPCLSQATFGSAQMSWSSVYIFKNGRTKGILSESATVGLSLAFLEIRTYHGRTPGLHGCMGCVPRYLGRMVSSTSSGGRSADAFVSKRQSGCISLAEKFTSFLA